MMNSTGRYQKLLPILIAVVLAGGGTYWWFNHTEHPSADAEGRTRHQINGNTGGHRGGNRTLPPVQAAEAITQSVPQFLSGLGTVTAANTVTLRSRVEGELTAIHFDEGQEVQAGQLLAEIDPRPWQVALAQAQGQLAKDQATLANARRDLARYEKLAKGNLVSQQETDAQRALVSETLGTIKVDEANVASAQLNLSWSRITAPISGRVGLRQVDIGNYVSSSDTNGIVVITQTHPIDLVFSLPENTISTLLATQKSSKTVEVEAWDRGNKTLLTRGTLLSLDNQVDATTGTIKLKARFANTDDVLFPNQFVNARLKVSTLHDAIVIPAAAVQMGNEGHFVWIVSADHHVSKKAVTIGPEDSQKVVITAGLNAGEQVVTDGIDRLTEGAKVEVIVSHAPLVTPGNAGQPAKGAAS